MKVEILRSARDDLIAAFHFHERREKGVGTYFLDCLTADIANLERSAGIHPVRRGYHCMLSRRFPYATYYRIRDDTVRIHAVLDTRRDPAWIARKLK